MKAQHCEIEIELTPNNLKKLMKHENTLIKHQQMGCGKYSVYISPSKAKKMEKAMKQGKGIKLCLSPTELDSTMKHGKGFKEMLRGASKYFRENVKPELKKKIHSAISKHGDVLEQKVEQVIEPHLGKTTSKLISKSVKPILHRGVNKILGEDKKPSQNIDVDLGEDNILTREGFGKFSNKKVKSKRRGVLRKGLIDMTDVKPEQIQVQGVKHFTTNPADAILLSSRKSKGGKITLKDVGRAYRQYVRPVVAPVIKKGLKTALQSAVPVVATALGNPELTPIGEALVSQYGDKAIDLVGKTTGAFGLKKGRLKSDYSTFLSHEHPAMNPGDTRYTQGGSFRPVGMGIGTKRCGSFAPVGTP